MPKTLVLEFNELSSPLMHRFIDEGKLPNFKRLFEQSQVYTTDADEEGLSLNPWIQWVTVHTGRSFDDHGVFLLGEGDELEVPTLADLASAAGKRVFLCGSMNIRASEDTNGIVVPDAWSGVSMPKPADIEPYYRFVSQSVQEHTNESNALGLGAKIDFLRFMATHGLSFSTLRDIIRQLLRERTGQWAWQRVAILERLQWDVFRHFYKKLQPEFSTFFLNSVAHLQHAHWRNLEPEKFKIKPTAQEQAEYEDAVLFGYQSNDRLIGDVLDFIDDDTTLVFCTALSQQACQEWEDVGAKRFYRPKHFESITEFAGIEDRHEIAPVMSEEFWVEFEDETAAKSGETALMSLEVDGGKAFAVSRNGLRIYVGCSIFDEVKPGARLTQTQTGKSVEFYELMYMAESLKSGSHHPDGMFWIRTPERTHRVVEEKVPLLAVAPTILDLLDLEIPDSMPGKPLL